MSLILFNISLIFSNGNEITLLIPRIIAFTTVLNAETIPSFIPSKIFPPVEKTFLTASHAAENFSRNQSTTDPKTDVIPSHATDAPVLSLSHIPPKKFATGSITFDLNHSPTTEKTVLMPSQVVFAAVEILSHIALKKFATGVITFLLNQSETTSKTRFMIFQQPSASPITKSI